MQEAYNMKSPVLIEVGRRKAEKKFLHSVPLPIRLSAIVYHVDPGKVYVHPIKVTREEAARIEIPDGFNSVYVTIDDEGYFDDKKSTNSEKTDDPIYQQHYVVSKCTPAYRVSFGFENPLKLTRDSDKIIERLSNSDLICRDCGNPENIAQIFCTYKSDCTLRCPACDKKHH